jgi:hypothetical protein
MSNQADKRTAAQRIDDMERGLMALYQTADNMARDLMTIKEAIKLLGNKLDAVVKASNRGEQLNDEVISKIMVENNIEELKEKVQNLVNQGILQAAEEVSANSFVVGREVDENGQVQNPRMQFVVSALAENVKAKFPGAKAGQTLELEEGKWKFEILEVYNLVVPSAPQEAQPAQAEESTEAKS